VATVANGHTRQRSPNKLCNEREGDDSGGGVKLRVVGVNDP
jgi:hypothetical protein